MLFFQLINVKMPTIVGILLFMSRKISAFLLTVHGMGELSYCKKIYILGQI